MDKELLKIVLEDLNFIHNEWNISDISTSNLRRSSVTLRSLLVDNGGLLFKAAKDLKVYSLRVLYKELELNHNPTFYQEGGASSNGVIISNITFHNEALTEKQIKENHNKKRGITKSPIEIKKFIDKPSFIINGIKINKQEVIKYVSNKLGGAHYDIKRSENKPLDQKYKLLDTEIKNFEIAGKESIYYELLSIGQHFINSKDINKLRKKIKHQLSIL